MSKLRLPENYPYLYETHMHTTNGSICAYNTGAEMAMAYKEAGYTGIFVTEHNWGGNTAVQRQLPWRQWVDRFVRGYEEARAWGQQNGLAVFWGYEAGYDGTEFLIYGITPTFLKEHPELRQASVSEQYRIIKSAGGIVVHAHPFRDARYIPKIRLYPEYVDAVEGINGSHHNRFQAGGHSDHEDFNRSAVAYARENKLPLTAGSDMHNTRLIGAGMAFVRKLTGAADFCNSILTGEDYLLTDGICWYDRNGETVAQVIWEQE